MSDPHGFTTHRAYRVFQWSGMYGVQTPIAVCESQFCFHQLSTFGQFHLYVAASSSKSEVFVKIKCDIKLKKVGKTTRPFRYNLNQIPYDYTVEMRNRFKGLDLIDRAPDELGTEVCDMYRRQGSRPSPRKRYAEKQNGCLGRPYK